VSGSSIREWRRITLARETLKKEIGTIRIGESGGENETRFNIERTAGIKRQWETVVNLLSDHKRITAQ
jgi:hypothetical protein